MAYRAGVKRHLGDEHLGAYPFQPPAARLEPLVCGYGAADALAGDSVSSIAPLLHLDRPLPDRDGLSPESVGAVCGRWGQHLHLSTVFPAMMGVTGSAGAATA
jgi:hypothetical protein